MQTVAQGWLILLLTGSPFILGVAAAARSLPVLVLVVPAGIVADRFDRRKIVVATALARYDFTAFDASTPPPVRRSVTMAPKGGVPMQNGGELPLLYALVFLFFAGHGAGPLSLDHSISRRR